MDVASPIESRIAGRKSVSGTSFTFTARKPITLATPFARDWHNRGFNRPKSSDSSASSVANSDGDADGGRYARYRSYHPPSATGEGRAP